MNIKRHIQIRKEETRQRVRVQTQKNAQSRAGNEPMSNRFTASVVDDDGR